MQSSFRDLGNELQLPPEPGAVTDSNLVRLLESTTPNIANAWTHVVPALTKITRCEGKRSLFGGDKGEAAYRALKDKLYLVVLGLYGDGRLAQGASVEDCLSAIIESLVSFKRAYPNWMDAYSVGYKVFVEGREGIKPTLANHQQKVETKLFNQG